jgi:hypothetical protein
VDGHVKPSLRPDHFARLFFEKALTMFRELVLNGVHDRSGTPKPILGQDEYDVPAESSEQGGAEHISLQ